MMAYLRIGFVPPLLAIALAVLPSCQTPAPKKPKLSQEDYLRKGKRQFQRKNWQKAHRYFTKAKRIAPPSRTLLKYIGVTRYYLGDYQNSVEALKKIAVKATADFEVHFFMAEAQRKRGEFAEAVYFYKKALEFDAGSLKALRGLAWSYFQIKYYKGALDAADRLAATKPNDVPTLLLIARIYNKVGYLGKSENAVKTAEYYAQESNRAYVYSLKAQLLFHLGKIKEAKKLLKKALHLEPLLESALLTMGKCLLVEGKETEKAITYLKRAVRLNDAQIEGLFLLSQNRRLLSKKEAHDYTQRFYAQAKYDPEYFHLVPLRKGGGVH